MIHRAREEGRIKVPKMLLVDASMIYSKTTLFSVINANDSGASVGEDFDSFNRIRFDIATASRRWDGEEEKGYRQAEVLVKRHVPLDLIKNL